MKEGHVIVCVGEHPGYCRGHLVEFSFGLFCLIGCHFLPLLAAGSKQEVFPSGSKLDKAIVTF